LKEIIEESETKQKSSEISERSMIMKNEDENNEYSFDLALIIFCI